MKAGFWHGKRVLLTGHTGFKGAWTAAILHDFGAAVTGFSLAPDSVPSLWDQFAGQISIDSHIGDLRDLTLLKRVVAHAAPQIVIHMAAQAQVRESYRDPTGTFTSNVTGTVNVLEALRDQENLESILVVTSDKVYRNDERATAFAEDAELGGSDPYSASKAACEIIVRSYAESFFAPKGIPVVTARAGNVIGGGDWSSDRLVPDVCRAAEAGRAVILRYPHSTRPWQHVLTCLDGYFRYIEYLSAAGSSAPSALNFGPPTGSGMTVAEMADAIGNALGNRKPWALTNDPTPPEKRTLALDCSRSQSVLAWIPPLDAAAAVERTAAWYAAAAKGEEALALTRAQIERYLTL